MMKIINHKGFQIEHYGRGNAAAVRWDLVYGKGTPAEAFPNLTAARHAINHYVGEGAAS